MVPMPISCARSVLQNIAKRQPTKIRTGKEIKFRFGSSEEKADTARRSRSQPKIEDNLFTRPNFFNFAF
jgi:hypothetical protein